MVTTALHWLRSVTWGDRTPLERFFLVVGAYGTLRTGMGFVISDIGAAGRHLPGVLESVSALVLSRWFGAVALFVSVVGFFGLYVRSTRRHRNLRPRETIVTKLSPAPKQDRGQESLPDHFVGTPGWRAACEYEGSDSLFGRGISTAIEREDVEDANQFRCFVIGPNDYWAENKKDAFGLGSREFHWPTQFEPKPPSPWPLGEYFTRWYGEFGEEITGVSEWGLAEATFWIRPGGVIAVPAAPLADHRTYLVPPHKHSVEEWQAECVLIDPSDGHRRLALSFKKTDPHSPDEDIYCVIQFEDQPPLHVAVRPGGGWKQTGPTHEMFFYYPDSRDTPTVPQKWPLDPGDYRITWMAAGENPRTLCEFTLSALPDGRVIPLE